MKDHVSHRLSYLNPREKKEVSYYSIILFACFLALSALGLMTLYSANQFYFWGQLKHFGLGFGVVLVLGFLIPFRLVQSLSVPAHTLLFLCLCFVLLFGYTAGGAQRWLVVGGFFRFQPSEFIKISTVLFFSSFFYHQNLKSEYSLFEIWQVLLNGILIFALIFLQPDFGTAGLCLGITLFQLFFIKLRISSFSFRLMAALLAVTPAVGWFFLLKPYQKLRILTLLNPMKDPTGAGYNSLQSLVAIGSGGFFGKGLMEGSQTQLHFLPARHTDFIFSVFSEEFGFLGCLVVLSLFLVMFLTGLAIARESSDLFKKLTACGLVGFLFLEFFINIAMVIGIFPVVGMALPFFSAGGSSVLTVCVAVSLLIAIDRSNRKALKDVLL